MKKISNAFLAVILAIVFGFSSGILGFIIIGSNQSLLTFWGRLNISGDNSDQQIIIDRPRNVIVQQDLQLQQIQNDLLPALVNIYSPSKGGTILDKLNTNNSYVGQGFVLTADGWVVTAKAAIANPKGKYTAVGYENKQYALEDFVEDGVYKIEFVKTAAKNLPVARLGTISDLQIGQTVVLISGRHNFSLGHIKKIGYSFNTAKESILSSDLIQREIIIDLALDASQNGAVVANLKGEIIGLVNAGKIVPVANFRSAIDQVLNGKPIAYPALQLQYLDLAQTEGLAELGDKGAYVFAAAKDSPVFNKLKEGDIIKKVNDTELSVFVGLAEVISGYKPGDKIELLFSRAGQDQSLSVTLK